MDAMANHLRRIARGRHGAQDLDQDAARAALSHLLRADADPLQLGAFLIAQRMKGESSAELAGFVQASREHLAGAGDGFAHGRWVDLPCYAGKRRAVATHLLAALDARERGIGVVVHGLDAIEGRVDAWAFLRQAGVRRARDVREARHILQGEGIVFLSLADLCPALARLIALRERLGVRTFAHTVARLLNPLACAGQLNGVFHAPYVARMCEVNMLLGQPRSLIFMGAEGEPELYADRQKGMRYQQNGQTWTVAFAPASVPAYPREPVPGECLLRDFAELRAGGYDERVAAVLARMRQAFDIVAGGSWPEDWRKQEG